MTWLSTTDMAASLRVSAATVQRLRHDPKWPVEASKREGATTYWHREKLSEFLSQRAPNLKGRPRKLAVDTI